VSVSSTIRDELAAALGHGREIENIAVYPHAYRTSHPLTNVEVAYTDGSSESLVLKDLGPDCLAHRSRDGESSLADDSLREIEVYRCVLAGAGLGTAAFRGALVDQSRGRFWLVIERVEATELWQLSLGAWCRTATWLAHMHRACRAESDHLVRWTPKYAKAWIARANEFCSDPAVRLVAQRSDELVERLLSLPSGFIHGELYASNVLVDVRRGRVCPVDWEMAGVGPFLLDLAALASGAWTDGERGEIAAAYLQGTGGVTSFDDLLTNLDVCRLYIALYWLGWSPGWVPPPEHAHDWLADVNVLVEKVGLA
jgi:hypothetical protein